MTTLLSIDWDWVTGDCCPCQHGCCGWCDPPPHGGPRRGEARLALVGRDERLAILRSLAHTGKGGHLWVAECHADILRVVKPHMTTRIVHLDAHGDDYPYVGLCCGSWVRFLPSGTEAAVPQDGLPGLEWHDVFVCQSSPWTPSELDDDLWDLVSHLSDMLGREPRFVGHRRGDQERAWGCAQKRGSRTETRP
jgi:hypothetical protein